MSTATVSFAKKSSLKNTYKEWLEIFIRRSYAAIPLNL